jgi:hypothetical protein
MTKQLRAKVEQMALDTGCEVRINALGNPMFTLTTTELIQFMATAMDEADNIRQILVDD